MTLMKREISKLLSPDAAAQLLAKIDKLALSDPTYEGQLTFAASALMQGELHPSASVALGVIKSIEDTDLFLALVLIGQALPLLTEQEYFGEAIRTVLSRGLAQCAQKISEKAIILDEEE
jgi:hypothetical protein